MAMYEWHIWQRSGERMINNVATDITKKSLLDYHDAAANLFWSMHNDGFMDYGAIDIDPNGELLSGSHRLACAIALGIKEVRVLRHTRMAWAPPWDRAWFEENPNRLLTGRVQSAWLGVLDEEFERINGYG